MSGRDKWSVSTSDYIVGKEDDSGNLCSSNSTNVIICSKSS